MKVNPHTGCGGGATTAKITINVINWFNMTHYDRDTVSVCHTKAIQYPTGKTAVWKSDDQLKNCTEIKVNPKESRIYYTINPTNKYRRYCIDEVAVIFDDQELTKFMKDTADDWRTGVSEKFYLTKQ